MNAYALMLRAASIRGRSQLPTADLGALLSDLGARDVATYLTSGNAVIVHDAPRETVQRLVQNAIHKHSGGESAILMRELDELTAVLDNNPFPNAATSTLSVLFTDEDLPADLTENTRALTTQRLAPGPGVVYIQYVDDHGRQAFHHVLQVKGTVRSLHTVRALHRMLSERLVK